MDECYIPLVIASIIVFIIIVIFIIYKLHPNNEEKTYELLDVPILTTEIVELFKEREKQVKRT